MNSKFRVSIIGCGHMGGNILRRLLTDGFRPAGIVLYDTSKEKLAPLLVEFPSCEQAPTAAEAISASDITILAIRPQNLDALETELKDEDLGLSKGKAVISVVTAKTMRRLEQVMNMDSLIRCSTNILLESGNGASFWLSQNVEPELLKACREIISSWGYERQATTENEVNTAIVDSGCMPAIVSYFYDSLIQAMVGRGRSEEEARQLVLNVAAQTAFRELEHNLDPAKVVAEVKTPGGITAEACKVFDESELHRIVLEALSAADRRVKELE